MATRKKEKQRKGSFILNAVNAFTAFIYSLFAHGRVGSWMSVANESYEDSYCAQILDNTARSKKQGTLKKHADTVLKESRGLRILDSLRKLMSSLKVNVYGMFFLMYGMTSAIVYFVPILLYGKSNHAVSSLFTSVTLIVCSLPLLMSSKTLAATVYEHRTLKKIFLSFFGIPEEKLVSIKEKTGGAVGMFIASLIAVGCGVLTYFVHSSYLLFVVAILIVFCLVTSTTETGVAITLAATPFLRYFSVSDIILVSLILLTAISYIAKMLKHRRVISFSAESVIVFVFCGFILVTSLFSDGGMRTVLDSLYSVVVILGGFFMTYNLIRDRKRLNACVKIMAVSFCILAVVGLWNVFYDAIADGFIHSIHEYARPIFEGQSINIADSAEVYGVLAVIVTPLLFAYMSKQRTVSGVFLRCVLLVLVMVSVFIYGTYEAAIAILIEFCLFWLIYSHKTLTTVMVLLVPIGIFTMLYPYVSSYVDFGEALNSISWILPEESANAPIRMSVFESVWEMLSNGNFLGIGSGEHAFVSAHSAYANAVSDGATSSGSLWLQVLCWSGIGGAVTFVIFSFIILRNGLGYVASIRSHENKREALALTVGIFASLVFGTVSCLWDDMRMLYLFWTAAGLLAGYVRVGREEQQKDKTEYSNNETDFDVEVRFYK
ncbi:MAG: hypothetical protein E7592_00780 [Ruminococcaceae bacterium]|nr:hypothetical protein [Oscillospiraceae bacterium]